MSLRHVKCGNCKKTDVFSLHKTGEWYWVRCRRCGFHTSSFTVKSDAEQACANGCVYVSENGNKFNEL